ncbi:hypothetical protein RUM43_010573 [Polyplax serrata]|uniref:Uncharacterized protein n=1 Tax=Polyplax serrata TaxID=468196 RepID=A0AAN8S4Y1_POLSC
MAKERKRKREGRSGGRGRGFGGMGWCMEEDPPPAAPNASRRSSTGTFQTKKMCTDLWKLRRKRHLLQSERIKVVQQHKLQKKLLQHPLRTPSLYEGKKYDS